MVPLHLHPPNPQLFSSVFKRESEREMRRPRRAPLLTQQVLVIVPERVNQPEIKDSYVWKYNWKSFLCASDPIKERGGFQIPGILEIFNGTWRKQAVVVRDLQLSLLSATNAASAYSCCANHPQHKHRNTRKFQMRGGEGGGGS